MSKIDWNPYDWLAGIERQLNDLTTKHNQVVKNQQELTLAHNGLAHRVKILEDRLTSIEQHINSKKDGVKALTDDVVDQLAKTFSNKLKGLDK
jgi:septation ring formation regulator EzrA